MKVQALLGNGEAAIKRRHLAELRHDDEAVKAQLRTLQLQGLDVKAKTSRNPRMFHINRAMGHANRIARSY